MTGVTGTDGGLGGAGGPGAAYLVEAVRTPVGRRGGGLAGVHPADLGAAAITALLERSGIDPAVVDDVVFGCLDQVGPQAANVARTCWLAAGLPEHVPGVTVDRQCGSAQQALHFAAQAVMSGTADVVVAGGVQNMSQIPLGTALGVAPAPLPGPGGTEVRPPADPYSGSAGWVARYGDQPVTQFHGAELIAERWDISRAEMEEFALRSHRRAVAAIDAGLFDQEIVPVAGVSADEGPRRDTSLEKMAQLRTLRPGGRLTAAVSSQISDGAAALLVVNERALRRYGLTPRARVHHMSVRGDDPIMMLTAPIPATAHALERCGMTIGEMDAIEINEAFAPVVLAWLRETGADPERVNPLGGAIALGHPLGATGARLMTTLLHHLERTGGRWGLQTMCEGGGQANVTIIERLG
ncbi:acetyl-CoA C-acetyltransferase [Allostreptomyces psammosilenae]|uniref:Acetyl-CoA C-acetyltransferase n=1 Tax=Allostreptomyces psammosilenae TaxID=1892865 RepID=A0A853ABK2_9ACTN|nr:acetyl-CoA C-acetyltransferase [Allostreptomyces psammosilenae]NYI07752.1 acetyl-CoA C-acetyltransferase [Allostreptomyces psammosilenae]